MPLRHLLRVAIFGGALSIVGGQAAHAQTPSSVRFVNLLLSNESKSIQATMKAFNTRNADIVKLNNATSQRTVPFAIAGGYSTLPNIPEVIGIVPVRPFRSMTSSVIVEKRM